MLISLQELKYPDQLDLLACAARAEGFQMLDRLQLRTHTPEADAFYRALGFVVWKVILTVRICERLLTDTRFLFFWGDLSRYL